MTTNSYIYNNTVRMNGDRFRILCVGTLNADADNAGAAAEGLSALIDRTSPDLLFLCGDITRAQSDTDGLRNVLSVLLEPATVRKLPWAHVFGDTDRAGGLPNEAAMPVYRSIPGCLSEPGPDDTDGCGNYVLTLTDGDGVPVFRIVCLDSHSGVHDYERDYGSPTSARLSNPLYGKYYLDGIRFNQTMFVRTHSRETERACGRKVPAMLLFHIPIPEITYVPMNPTQTKMRGYQNETVRCQVVSGGLFPAALECGDVRAIFAGHSEENDFSGICGRILLGQMRDSVNRDRTFRGGTLFEISADGTVSAEPV